MPLHTPLGPSSRSPSRRSLLVGTFDEVNPCQAQQGSSWQLHPSSVQVRPRRIDAQSESTQSSNEEVSGIVVEGNGQVRMEVEVHPSVRWKAKLEEVIMMWMIHMELLLLLTESVMLIAQLMVMVMVTWDSRRNQGGANGYLETRCAARRSSRRTTHVPAAIWPVVLVVERALPLRSICVVTTLT